MAWLLRRRRLRRRGGGGRPFPSRHAFCRRALTYRQLLGLLLEAAQAMAHLHSKGVVHLDLKGDNLLVDFGQGPRHNELTCKVTDFGLARQIQSSRTHVSMSDPAGTL